jgi:outer membrane lipoprotein-sorting protein
MEVDKFDHFSCGRVPLSMHRMTRQQSASRIDFLSKERILNKWLLPSRFSCLSHSRTIASMIMRWQKRTVALCLGLTLLNVGQMSRAADDQRAREIVDRVARLFISKSSISEVEMQITNENWQRNISMRIWSLGEEKILVRIISPPEDAGTAILKVGSNSWYYLPKTKRTIKTPASMTMTSWMGSHFTLDDLVKQSYLTNDYVITTAFEGTRNGVAVYEYTLTPKPTTVVVWGKVLLQVRQADQMPTWQRYYDEDGKPVRELTFSEYITVKRRLIPTRLVMRPLNKSGEQTVILYKNVNFDVPISDETFLLSNLQR